MATPIICAIDQDATHAHLAHLAERDLDPPAVGFSAGAMSGRTRHHAKNGADRTESNYQSLGPRNAGELLRVVGVENRSQEAQFAVAGCSRETAEEAKAARPAV